MSSVAAATGVDAAIQQPTPEYLKPSALPAPTRPMHIGPSGDNIDNRFVAATPTKPECTPASRSLSAPQQRARLRLPATVCSQPATPRLRTADLLHGSAAAHPAVVKPTAANSTAVDMDPQPVQATAAAALLSPRGSQPTATLTSNPPGSYASPDWRQQPSGALGGRYGAATAYDSAHQVVVLFGGIGPSGTYLNDTWTWNGQVWTQAVVTGAAPAPRAYAHMAFDTAHGKVVLFGGYSTVNGVATDYADTWTWDGTAWTQQSLATSPHGRDSGSMDYLPAAGTVVLFGGTYSDTAGQHDLNDTWAWNGTTWTQLGPFATQPSPRFGHQLTYDGATGQLVLFGGIQSNTSNALGDTWTYFSGAWTQASPSGAPTARYAHSLVFDAALNGVLLFGGYSTVSPAGNENDTWLWNGSTWLQAIGIASPIGRELAATAYDAPNNQVVVTGGYDGAVLGDTWTYTEGSSGVPVAPSLSAAVDRSPAVYGRAELATVSLVIGNHSTSVMQGASLTDSVGSGLQILASSLTITDNGTGGGITCAGSVSCTVRSTSITVIGLTIPSDDSLTISYAAFTLGLERGCATGSDAAQATSSAGSSSATATLTMCDSGLGAQPWWQYTNVALGGGSSAAVDMADGNMLVTANDSEIPLHGSLSFSLHRAYNSEDSGIALPGALASNWFLTVDQGDSIAAGGVTAAGLYVTPGELYGDSRPVALIDRNGSRQVFTPRVLAQPIDVTGLTPTSTNALGTLAPRALQMDAGYDHLCVDQAYTAPPGIHLSLWRYVELRAASPSTPCVPGVGRQGGEQVLGYAAERPDRLRFEFNWDGHKVDLQDANANELRYQYFGSLASGARVDALQSVTELATGRAMRFTTTSTEVDVTDPAFRVTRYRFDSASAPQHLVQVASGYAWDYSVSPAALKLVYAKAGAVNYGYGSCTGATANQMCMALDARSNPTRFTYVAQSPEGTPYAGPPHVATITDRSAASTPQTAVTTMTYHTSPDWATADHASERTAVRLFDTIGRAAQVQAGDTSDNYLHVTVQRWDVSDPSLAPCRQPDAVTDNNLCRVFRYTLDGSSTAEDTSYVYNADGRVLRTRQCLAAADPSAGQGLPNCTTGWRTSSNGYRSQYVESDGTVSVYTDNVQGDGSVQSQSGPGASGARLDGKTLFSLADATQVLTPRGNASGQGYTVYLTTMQVDATATVPANLRPTSSTCSPPPTYAANTGNVCEVDAPAYDSTGAPTVTRMTYDVAGQLIQSVRPLAVQDQQLGQPPAPTVLTYYQDGDGDISGTSSSAGWLKSVQDPLGNTTVFAYDAAGNRVRTWKPNATQGVAVSYFPGDINTPPSSQYSENVYSELPGTQAYSYPWRYLVRSRDAAGDTTVYTVDQNGNQVAVRPPRGVTAGSSAFDITNAYDALDRLTSTLAPVEAAHNPPLPITYAYDAFGNKTATTDSTGMVTANSYDSVNRVVTTRWTRDPVGKSPAPPTCHTSGSADGSAIPANTIVCLTSRTYDGVDNVLTSVDPSQQPTTYAYDALHQKVRTLAPRNDGVLGTLRTDTVYDLDGNATDVCPPREFADGGSSVCTTTGAYSMHRSFDAFDRLVTQTTYPSPGGSAQTSTTGYDADGNVVSQRNADQSVTRSTYDLLDRATSTTVPRTANGSTSFTTTSTYDGNGNLTSTTRQGLPASSQPPFAPDMVTAYSYDAADRLVDTVIGADDPNARMAGRHGSYDPGSANVRTRKVYDADGHVIAVYSPNAFSPSGVADSSGLWGWLPNSAYMQRTDFDADGRSSATYAPRYGAGAPDPGLDQVAGTSYSGGTQVAQCRTGVQPQGAPQYDAGIGVCVTTFTYDASGHVIRKRLPTSNGSDNRFVAYTYTQDHLLQTQAGADPSAAPFTAQPLTTATYVYDANGRRIQQLDAQNNSSTVSYFADGLVATEVGTPGANNLSHQSSYRYDANGNRTLATDALTHTTLTAYTADNRVRSVTDPGGDVTGYTYDPVGNVLSVSSPSANAQDATNPTGLATVNTYTADNLLLSTARPVSCPAPQGSTCPAGTAVYRTIKYGYDGLGRKVSQSMTFGPATGPQNAGMQAYSYYPDGRMSRGDGNYNGDASSSHDFITYAYDANGNRTDVQDHTRVAANPLIDTTASYYLDNLPRTVAETSQQLPTGSTAYSYDAMGSTTARQSTVAGSPGQLTATYLYSDADMVASISSPVGSPDGRALQTTSYAYDNLGRLTTLGFGNGVSRSMAYNPDGTLRSLNDTASGTVASWQYTWDGDYRLAATAHSRVGPDGRTTSTSQQYGYNLAGRLSSFFDGTSNWTATWDHDGNRLSWSNGGATQSSTYTYNADDSISTGQMGSLPPVHYTYLAFGQIASDGCLQYGYDDFDRLDSTNPAPSTTNCGHLVAATYFNDGLDRQVQRTTGGTLSNAAYYYYDGVSTTMTDSLASVNAGPLTRTSYLLDPRSRRLSDTQYGQTATSETLLDDGRGTVTTVMGTANHVVCSADFDPFGQPTGTASSVSSCSSGTANNEFFYRSGHQDTATGTYEMGARTYDPAKGSFLQADRVRSSAFGDGRLDLGLDTRNRFSFAAGDPVNFMDSSGNNPCRYDDCTPEENRALAASDRGADTTGSWTPHRTYASPPKSGGGKPKPAPSPEQLTTTVTAIGDGSDALTAAGGTASGAASGFEAAGEANFQLEVNKLYADAADLQQYATESPRAYIQSLGLIPRLVLRFTGKEKDFLTACTCLGKEARAHLEQEVDKLTKSIGADEITPRAARVLGALGDGINVLGFITSFTGGVLSQLKDDAGKNYSTADEVLRAGTRGAADAGTGWLAGLEAGGRSAAACGKLGSRLFPEAPEGVGAFAAVCGIVGGFLAGLGGEKAVDWMIGQVDAMTPSGIYGEAGECGDTFGGSTIAGTHKDGGFVPCGGDTPMPDPRPNSTLMPGQGSSGVDKVRA